MVIRTQGVERMTEKRFTFIQDTLVKADVFDGDEFVCCTLSVWVEQLVDLLNQLNNENEQLKKELQRMYDVATLNKAIELLENKYDKMLSDGSDEIKDAMRHTVLRCIEDLDELKDDITAR